MKMMDARKGQSNNVHYEHTSRILERRRSLFPSDIDSDEDSDLGHISPLHFDSDLEDFNYLQHEDNGSLLSKTDSIEDYDILGVVEHIQGSFCTPINAKNNACSETMSPLCISPCLKITENGVINETPSKMSPIYKLKTPHDTCNTNSKLPKLVRKSLLDSTENSFSKRQLSPLNSPEGNKAKQLKLDPKNSKVRTTLFPEVDISLPTKSFYPKTENIMEKVPPKRNTFSKSPVLHNSVRKIKTRKRDGQINAGVCHKIRKPKRKTVKISLVKTTMNTVTNSAINDYIKDLKQLNMPQNGHMIILTENKENTDPAPKMIDHKIIIPKLIEPVVHNDTSKTLEMSNNKKRPLSPISEPDPKKKFFKFSRGKGVVTVNKNIKVQVDHGKMTIIETGKKKKISQKIDYDSSDFSVEDPLLPNIDSILSSLETDNDINLNENGSKIILQAHSSVCASENSILLHPQPVQCTANLILSPISQMCDVTSGLALNSPKKARNLTSILNDMPDAASAVMNGANVFNNLASSNVVEQKLFPIFNNRNIAIPEKKQNKTFTRTAKKFKNLEESQMLLDAGQKKFGVTQCPECNIVYHIGDPSDENMHLSYHNAGHVLKFSGWRNERVVADFHNNGRIIQIVHGDSKIWWKKVKDLMDVINRELGCFELEFNLDHSQVFLYIKSRTIIGCVVTVPKSEGHKMLTTKQNEADMCSEEKYPIKCGVSRIWVSHNFRKQGIGSALMNSVKKNFMFGYVLENNDIALSPPTEMGKSFAKNYFKTSNYLIYYV